MSVGALTSVELTMAIERVSSQCFLAEVVRCLPKARSEAARPDARVQAATTRSGGKLNVWACDLRIGSLPERYDFGMPRFRGGTRWFLAGAAVVVALGTALAVTLTRAQGWKEASSVVTVVSLPVAMFACFLALVSIAPLSSIPDMGVRDLGEVIDQLAVAVRRQWEAEADLRRIRDPHFIPISWHPVSPEFVDDWASLERLAHMWAEAEGVDRDRWASCPDALSGTDADLVDVLLHRIPTRRLVVLGEGGAGKTVLLVRLILEILTTREPGQAVPVLLPMASWIPSEEDLADWAEAQLIQDYPGLRERLPGRSDGVTRASALMDHKRLILILDGLDELTLPARRAAISQINCGLKAGQSIVLVSRAAEYLETAEPAHGLPHRIFGAAGVLLDRLDPMATARYLRQDAWDPSAATRWDPVIRQLSLDTPIAWAFRTPLMVGLARTIYNPRPGERSSSDRDPRELCDLPTATAIVNHLFDAYIRAAYRGNTRWPTEKAERWLTFLAHHVNNKTPAATDFKWWELRDATTKYSSGAVAGLLTGLATALVVALGQKNLGIGIGMGLFVGLLVSAGSRHLARGARGSLAQAFAGGVVGGFLGGLIGAFISSFVAGTGLNLTGGLIGGIEVGLGVAVIGGRTGGFAGGIAGGMTVAVFAGRLPGLGGAVIDGLAVALVVALTVEIEGQKLPSRGFHQIHWSPVGLIAGCGAGAAVSLNADLGLTLGLVAGTVTGLATGLVAGLDGSSVDLTETTSPAVSLRRDRGSFWITGLATAVALGLTVGLGIQPSVGIAAGFAFGLTVAFLQACTGSFAIARLELALRGHLPFRTMRFLADAHQTRGVLRQVGAVYQFRHTDLQRHLASRPYLPTGAEI